jgi:predicted RecB family nuclease
MAQPWQTRKPPDFNRLTKGKGHSRRETLIRRLEECRPDPDHISLAEFADGEARPVLPPRVLAVLNELRQCSRLIIKGSRRHRHRCLQSLCPSCNRYGNSKAVYRGEAQRGWKLIAHTHSDPREFHFLSINVIELDRDSPEFPQYAERARYRMKRILSEHPGMILLGQFEFNATSRDQIKLGLHGWLIGSAEQAEQIKLACCDYFGFGHPVNMKPIDPGILRDEFLYTLGYACKLPKLIFRCARGYRVSLSQLVGLIDQFERIRSRTGRQGLRLEIGIRTGYISGDIKSGAGEEGPEDLSKPKLHYAVQVALYTDILERIGMSAGRRPFIWDIHGREVMYDLDVLQGSRDPRSLWSDYQDSLAAVRQILSRAAVTLPAYGGVCKECHWYTACQAQLGAADDLTLMFDLGRSKRDVLRGQIPTMQALAEINPAAFVTGKKTVFKGIGPDTLVRLHERAKLLKSSNPQPYLRTSVQLPLSDLEVFFDIEVDPMHDHTYLHGFIERRNGDNATERYTAVFADSVSEQAERDAFARAWAYLQERPAAIIYFYSPYERTYWRKLREKYPDVCSQDELESLFTPARSVDLYTDIVRKATEWPTRDYSIKTLAKFLGFKWHDAHPSGAASIEWFARWIETDDLAIKQRILDYNEDDCRATRWLLDGIRALAS